MFGTVNVEKEAACSYAVRQVFDPDPISGVFVFAVILLHRMNYYVSAYYVVSTVVNCEELRRTPFAVLLYCWRCGLGCAATCWAPSSGVH